MSDLRPAVEDVTAALATVDDPEIGRPITDLGMVKSVDVREDWHRGRRGLPDGLRLPDAGRDHRPGRARGEQGERRHRRAR